jgi:hypothetical protein
LKYYLCYKGKILGYTMDKDEAERVLSRVRSVVTGLEIIAVNDKITPMGKHKRLRSWNKKST